jgi:hypothetical protein
MKASTADIKTKFFDRRSLFAIRSTARFNSSDNRTQHATTVLLPGFFVPRIYFSPY